MPSPGPSRPPPAGSLPRALLAGFDRRSGVAVSLLLAAGGAVGLNWSDLVDPQGLVDFLLLGIWSWMALLLAWRVEPRRDLAMVFVGVGGGATIEWWGTNAELWAYFTEERPPLWILPAWPAAALAIDRMATLLEVLVERWERGTLGPAACRGLYYALVPPFVLWMTVFLWPRRDHFASLVVMGLMALVAAHTREPRRDLALFAAGTVMGVFLEYWGTSRECWTYYTRQVPPPVAVVAHGFAAVAFSRAASLVDGGLRWWSRARQPLVSE